MNDDSTSEPQSGVPESRLPLAGKDVNPCPRCGAGREAIEAACPVCAWAPPPPRHDADPPAVTWPMRAEAARTFSLESLMLVVTLVAVCLSVGVWAPGLGILLAVLCTPALVRTVVVQLRRKAQGQPLSVGEKLTTFLATLAVVVLILVAAIVALFLACLGIIVLSQAASKYPAPPPVTPTPPANAYSVQHGDRMIILTTIGFVAATAVAAWFLERRK